jgi:multiple sugar transport system substrate-binding protein
MENTIDLELSGSTWGHERGYGPLIGLNREHRELFPASVKWDVRSLQAFGDHSLEDLTNNFDLVIFDHPFIGEAAERNLLLPLNEYLDSKFLQNLSLNAIGNSYSSYLWKENLFALPIDVAGHVSAKRPDLFEKFGLSIPGNWDEVLELAKETSYSKGSMVAIPGFSVDLWCLFITISANSGVVPYSERGKFVPPEIGHKVFNYIKKLSDLSPKDSKLWNPIETLDAMSSRDEFIYSPALFGYSNYSKSNFRKSKIIFGPLPDAGNGSVGGILGGAGIGVSAKSGYPKEATKIAKILSSPDIQKGFYVEFGGQPGHKEAWTDKTNNLNTSNFSKLQDTQTPPRHPDCTTTNARKVFSLQKYIKVMSLN